MRQPRIAWRRHILSDALTAAGKADLALEPVLLVDHQATERDLLATTDEHVLSWQWGGWARVEARGLPHGARHLVERTSSPRLAWTTLGGAAELLPWDDHGVPGAPLLMDRPTPLSRELVVEVEPDALAGRALRVHGPAGHEVALASRVDASRWALERGPERLEGRRWTARLGWPFWGGVVLLRPAGDASKIMGFRTIDRHGRVGERLSEAERAAVRALVEVPGQRLRLASTLEGAEGSRRLDALQRAAENVAPLARHAAVLRAHTPTALHRAVVLETLGAPPTPPADPNLFSTGTFDTHLDALWPGSVQLLSRLPPPERARAMRHLDSPTLAEATTWAAGLGADALDRALALAVPRRRVRAVLAALASGAAVHDRARAVEATIERSVLEGSDPAPALASLASLEELVEQERARPVDATRTEPPATHEARARWEEARAAMDRWRTAAARLLSRSLGLDPSGDGSPEQLAGLAGRVVAQVPALRHVPEAPTDGGLAEEAGQLARTAGAEPLGDLRDQICKALVQALVPHARRWEAARRLWEAARPRIERLPGLALAAGIETGALPDVAALVRFDALEAALDDELRRWSSSRLAGDAELRAVLATPGHPHLLASVPRWAGLVAATPRSVAGVLPPVPQSGLLSGPVGSSLAAFQAWWDLLHGVETTLARRAARVAQAQERASAALERVRPCTLLPKAVARHLALYGTQTRLVPLDALSDLLLELATI